MVLPDDIPVARRQYSRPLSSSVRRKRQIQVWAVIVGAISIVLLTAGALLTVARVQPPSAAVVEATAASDRSSPASQLTEDQPPAAESSPSQSSSQSSAVPPSPATSQPPVETQPEEPESVLGHFAYEEASEVDLEVVGYYGERAERLKPAPAARFVEMVNAAAAAGITLMPVSGYRSIEVQEQLFFQVAQSRALRPQERALVSAPPGHSEHHTGYAIDIADASHPGAILNESFETTPAFRWLEANAARYGFELSFPRDNEQGVTYEPWHWRFVGDRHSLETFYGSNSRPQPVASDRAASPSAQ